MRGSAGIREKDGKDGRDIWRIWSEEKGRGE
jgi:hypothetical protein